MTFQQLQVLSVQASGDGLVADVRRSDAGVVTLRMRRLDSRAGSPMTAAKEVPAEAMEQPDADRSAREVFIELAASLAAEDMRRRLITVEEPTRIVSLS